MGNAEEAASRSSFLTLADRPIEGATEASPTENLLPLHNHGLGALADDAVATLTVEVGTALQLEEDDVIGNGGGQGILRIGSVGHKSD